MEEKLTDTFWREFYQLQSDVKRLTEHEANDSKKYERWHQEMVEKLNELGKMRLDLSNGRLTALEKVPIVVQLTKEDIRALFGEWGKAWEDGLAGRLSLKLILSVAGTVSAVVTAVAIAGIVAYFGFRG